jgi:ubiquinone/menaquinone biosynthesis C-methylase UbiE
VQSYFPMSLRGILSLLGFDRRRTGNVSVLERMRQDWDNRARENARHYIATLKTNWTDEEFFESGATSIREFIEASLPEICRGRPASELRMLEIGCGAGRMTRPLSSLFGQVDAVDISPEMIARAREAVRDRPNVRLYVNNGEDLAMFGDEQFDFVFSGVVFQHIPSRSVVENYIKESARVLRSGGVFRFQVQGHPIPEDQCDTWVGVSFSADDIQVLAGRYGFSIKEMRGEGTHYFWLTFVKSAVGRVM